MDGRGLGYRCNCDRDCAIPNSRPATLLNEIHDVTEISEELAVCFRGDEGLELSSKTSDSIQNGPGSGAESGAVGPVPVFWLNLGLGAEWAALSAATQAAVSELPLAALQELADLTSDIPNQFAATTAKIDGPSQ